MSISAISDIVVSRNGQSSAKIWHIVEGKKRSNEIARRLKRVRRGKSDDRADKPMSMKGPCGDRNQCQSCVSSRSKRPKAAVTTAIYVGERGAAGVPVARKAGDPIAASLRVAARLKRKSWQ